MEKEAFDSSYRQCTAFKFRTVHNRAKGLLPVERAAANVHSNPQQQNSTSGESVHVTCMFDHPCSVNTIRGDGHTRLDACCTRRH